MPRRTREVSNFQPLSLDDFKLITAVYPQHIVYYRDGVSESEFDTIRTQEGSKLHDLTLELGIQAKITLIVAIKRHHTRFFAGKEIASKLGNVPCGTVVENSASINDAFIIAQ
jgi:eukaryotic translation initiation factor 2C